MVSGSLVIGSKIGGIPEIIKDDELMFEPNNHNMLAKKKTNLIQKSIIIAKKKFNF